MWSQKKNLLTGIGTGILPHLSIDEKLVVLIIRVSPHSSEDFMSMVGNMSIKSTS